MTPPATFHGFDDVVEIGRGGFGVVYRARDVALGRTVAIKRLNGQLDAASRERFTREARAMSVLSGHPNVVPIHSIGEDAEGQPYFVMAFVAGGSLGAIVVGAPMPWADTLRTGVRLAGAVESAHRLGVLHRDLKPDNVLRSDFDEPLLTDFGIARVVGEFATSDQRVMASIAYATPEVLGGAAPAPTADVYGLGATLFTLVGGAAPFAPSRGETFAEVYGRIANGAVPDLRPSGVPPEVCSVIEAAMATDPARRPPTALALGEALQSVERDLGLAPTDMAILGPAPGLQAGSSRSRPGHVTETVVSSPPAGDPVTTEPDATAPGPAPTADAPAPTGGAGRRRPSPVVVVLVLVVALGLGIATISVLLAHQGSSSTASPASPDRPSGSSGPSASALDLAPGPPAALSEQPIVASAAVPAGRTSVLRFAATAGDRALARVRLGAAPAQPLEVDLLSDGSPLSQEPVTGPDTVVDSVALPIDGRYELDLSAPTEPIDVTVDLRLAPGDTVGSVSIGGPPTELSADQPRQAARWTFDGAAGRSVRASWHQTAGTPAYVSLSMVAPDGSTVAQWSAIGDGSSDPVTLPATGSYVVRASFDGDGVGAGTLAVTGGG